MAVPTPKQDAIQMAKTMLAQIPFNTVYSYADNLFDVKEVPFNDPSVQTQVDFLRTAKLSDIEYSGTDKADFFTMTNRATGESIQVSNRMSSRGELRGEKLRELLQQRKEDAPNEVAYDTITRAIRTADCSDMVTMLRGAVCRGEAAKMLYENPMSEEHFELFTEMVLLKIQEKIQNKTLPDDLEPRDIRDNETLKEEIWKDIDMEAIYDSTMAWAERLKLISEPLKQIKEKSEDLSRRGYPEAAKAARELYKGLTEQKLNLVQGKISVEEYGKNCNHLIEKAQTSELQNHRGFFGTIWHALKVALNAITLGAVEITPTRAIEKTMDMKTALQSFVSSQEPKLEEPEPPRESHEVTLGGPG